jgi:hypothetical protein
MAISWGSRTKVITFPALNHCNAHDHQSKAFRNCEEMGIVRAFMAELTFPSLDTAPMVFTTEVSVVPDVLPYEE